MSTWTSKVFPAVLLVALAACVPGGGGGVASPGASKSMALLGGEVQAAAPQGYCIDEKASHDEGDGAVVLIGRCSGTSKVPPALVTVTIGGPGSSAVLQEGAKALSDYFVSPSGRAALARDGRASSVAIRQTSVSDGALMLLVSDREVGTYWRAVLGLRGRLVTISVLAPEGQSLDPEQGRGILERTMGVMRRVNPSVTGEGKSDA